MKCPDDPDRISAMDLKELETYPFHELVYERRLLYSSTNAAPHAMRFEITLRDEIDPKKLQEAVNITRSRYPYFDVSLQRVEREYYFVSNDRPLLVMPYEKKAPLGSKANHFHQIALDHREKTIGFDIAHYLTDGAGAYEWMKTLLYYYLSGKTGRKLDARGIRLAGEDIPEEELSPVPSDIPFSSPKRNQMPEALTISGSEYKPVRYHFVLEEEPFIALVKSLGATPNTFFAVALTRMLRKANPEDKRLVRIAVCVNERRALGLQLAHQSLVGGAVLPFEESLESLPLRERFARVKAMFKEQTSSERILDSFSALRALIDLIAAKETDAERCAFSQYIRKYANNSVSSTVSYVGKANFGEMEEYVEDFATIALPTTGILTELSAIGGKIYVDLIMTEADERYPEELLRILDEFALPHRGFVALDLDAPNMELPWKD